MTYLFILLIINQSIDIDQSMRQSNYRSGSCVHASMATALRWQHLDQTADRWIKSYHGAENTTGLINKCKAANLNVAYTTDGDAYFLEWCSRTRRAAVIWYYPKHCVNFVGYVNGYAAIINNNNTRKITYIKKEVFVKNWRYYGGFALTPVYAPTPPRPK